MLDREDLAAQEARAFVADLRSEMKAAQDAYTLAQHRFRVAVNLAEKAGWLK